MMKKSNNKIIIEPSDVAPSKIILPITESLPMPEKIPVPTESAASEKLNRSRQDGGMLRRIFRLYFKPVYASNKSDSAGHEALQRKTTEPTKRDS